MTHGKSKVLGRYGRPAKKRRGLRISFRFLRKIFLLCFVLIGLGGAFYFAFLSDYFAIESINISGLKTVAEEDVRGRVNGVLDRRKWVVGRLSNYFLFSADLAEAEIEGAFPKIGALKIEKNYPKALSIFITERNAVGVWCREEKCFYLDKSGVIFEPAPRSFGGLMITVEDFRAIEGVSLSAAVLKEGEAMFFEEAKRLVTQNFPFGTKSFVITQRNEIEILTSENWRVLLDKKESIEYQLSNLKYLLDEKIRERRRELEYVDLRLGNRVYYRFAGAGESDRVDKN